MKKNWKKQFTLANQDEQLEAIALMSRYIEARQDRRVWVRGRLILERRRLQAAHYIGDRRGRYTLTRFVSLLTFAVVLVTVSIATWGIAVHAPISIGAPVLFFHLTSVTAVLAFKPYRLRTQPIE